MRRASPSSEQNRPRTAAVRRAACAAVEQSCDSPLRRHGAARRPDWPFGVLFALARLLRHSTIDGSKRVLGDNNERDRRED
jgi:hypothetical protein